MLYMDISEVAPGGMISHCSYLIDVFEDSRFIGLVGVILDDDGQVDACVTV